MAQIKKIVQTEHGNKVEVYPITSTQAVYNIKGKRIDDVLKDNMSLNVSIEYNASDSIEPMTLSEAIEKVPLNERSLGKRIIFLSQEGWVMYIYTGSDIEESWHNASQWNKVLVSSELRNLEDKMDEKFDEISDRYNILDSSKFSIGFSIDDGNGNIVNQFSDPSHHAISGFQKIKPNTQYSIYDLTSAESKMICFYDYNKNYLYKIQYSHSMNGQSFTTPPNAEYINIYCHSVAYEIDLEFLRRSIMIYNSTLPAPIDYIPYNKLFLKDYLIAESETIKQLNLKLKDIKRLIYGLDRFYEFAAAEIQWGRNLYNKDSFIRGKTINITENPPSPFDLPPFNFSEIQDLPNPNNGGISTFIPVKPATQYYLKFGEFGTKRGVTFFDEDRNLLHNEGYAFSENDTENNELGFITSEHTKYVVIIFGSPDKKVSDTMINDTSLNEGTYELPDKRFLILKSLSQKPL